MRKLIVGAFVSLDGVVERPWEWIGSFFDAQMQEHSLEDLEHIDTFLLSRKTYEHFAGHWPNIKGSAYMDRMNALSKLVVSNTLKEASWNATILSGDVASAVAAIKQENGKNIIKYGVGSLDQTLLKHKLIDEYHLSVIPIAIGKGKRLFEDVDTSQFQLKLKDTKRFDNGVVLLTYVP